LFAFNALDSVTVSHQDDVLAGIWLASSTRDERTEAAGYWVAAALNSGHPAVADQWLDTLRHLSPDAWAFFSSVRELVAGGSLTD
jgi:hypothetical protein